MSCNHDIQKIIEARHHDPFAVLGRHQEGDQIVVRTFKPGTKSVMINGHIPMWRIEGTDMFEWRGQADIGQHHQLVWIDNYDNQHTMHDPYTFQPQLSDFDLHLFAEGKHWHAYRFLGARKHEVDGVWGTLFSVWAPGAERVSVIGDFNDWDGRCHAMRARGGYGVWELFVPDLFEGALYKYEIRSREYGSVLVKSDPYARQAEIRPNTASIVPADSYYGWEDERWMHCRRNYDWQHSPISIYELHLGSWQRGEQGEFLNYRDIAGRLVAYVQEMGFTHVELMPITEHPFDLSWGYQVTGYYAPTSRFGSADDFRFFIDYLHRHDIGVILDWVPAHFPKDEHGLACFDGSPLYEHGDPRKGEHLDWSTLIFNYSRHEVKNFLLSSALYWLEEFHIDGLRVDAVASMLYLDYSREDWVPNEHGGRENLEAIAFLQQLNTVVHGQCPGVLIFAEESTSWPQVTKPVDTGGLGFDIKWNMGWMNDSLAFWAKEPVHRKYHHGELTFSLLYAFSENFVLPFSHDEVVHGKASMLYKMPGDEWQRFANLRLLYTYMFTHPGKKLLFMGTEFGQGSEWDSDKVLDWYVLEYGFHSGLHQLVKDLNGLYRRSPELHHSEFDWQGFEWLDSSDNQHSILSYYRKGPAGYFIVVLNLTPVPRESYRVGVPDAGEYLEIFNSDSSFYGGSNMGSGPDPLVAQEGEWCGRPYSVDIILPPLAGVVLRRK